MLFSTYKAEQVTIDGTYPLKGTLTIPEGAAGKLPAVLFIVGSGPVDRDGYVKKLKLSFNTYTQLAESITKLGFVTLRFDKRGVGQSGGDYFKTGMWDRSDDVESCIKYLEQHPAVNPEKIILMGHSEGCMLASLANARHPIGGMILLGGAAETLTQATDRQRKMAIDELMQAKGIKGAFYRLLKVDKLAEKQNAKLMDKLMKSQAETIRVGFVKLNAKWLREHYSHNVVDDLKKAECPVLAITGAKDSQADPERIKEVPNMLPGKGEYRIIEDMDHSLKEFKGTVSIRNAIKQYKLSEKQPVHPELAKTILEWLDRKFKA